MVKEAASRAILINMSLNKIINHFFDKNHQKTTICCTIKELLINNQPYGQNGLRNDIVQFLAQVLQSFDEGPGGQESNNES